MVSVTHGSGFPQWFVCLALLLPVAAQSAVPLLLNDEAHTIDAWPAITLLPDPERTLSAEQAIDALNRFMPPTSAYGTLGMRKDVVWLHIPVAVAPESDGEWILDIDYPVLDRIDMYLVTAGRIERHAVLGSMQAFSQRPIAGRTHAMRLQLQPGKHYGLLLRVDTTGSMVLPITLSKLSAFHQRALKEQMRQGLLIGLGLWLLLYSLSQWVSLRDHLYLKYAILITGSTLFSILLFGIGAQFVWTDNLWLEQHLGALSALIAAFGTALFVEHVLGADMSSRLRLAIRIVAGILAGTAITYSFGLIGIHLVSAVVSTAGLMPALLGVPGAIARVRRGDSVGAYFLLAWVGYVIATAIMIGLLQGYLWVNFWTMHSFQIGNAFDMLIFMRIAMLQTKTLHVAALNATRERDKLILLAHTDPLTGLVNRRGLNSALNAALPQASAENLLVVYVLDLDGFKSVNDRYGHDAGDNMLVSVAKQLRNSVRSADVVARLGGDEFVVIALGLHSDSEAQELGDKLLANLRAPLDLPQDGISVRATIGYALAPLDGITAASLLKQADAAMYMGKRDGKDVLRRRQAAVSN